MTRMACCCCAISDNGSQTNTTPKANRDQDQNRLHWARAAGMDPGVRLPHCEIFIDRWSLGYCWLRIHGMIVVQTRTHTPRFIHIARSLTVSGSLVPSWLTPHSHGCPTTHTCSNSTRCRVEDIDSMPYGLDGHLSRFTTKRGMLAVGQTEPARILVMHAQNLIHMEERTFLVCAPTNDKLMIVRAIASSRSFYCLFNLVT